MKILNRNKGYTLVEVLIVATIMIMVSGIVYTFYINMARITYRGTDNVLELQEAQNVLEVIARDVRSAAHLITLKPKHLVFQRYYNVTDTNAADPTEDLNNIRLRTVEYRLEEDEKGYFYFERREDLNPFEVFHKHFRKKNLKPEVFKGYRFNGKEYEIYNPSRHKPENVPLIQISLHVSREKQPLYLFKKIFLPAPFGKMKKMRQREFQGQMEGEAKIPQN